MKTWRPWGFLAVGAVFLLLATGRYSLALAAWLAPIFLVRFFRESRGLWRPLVGAGAFMAAYFVAWKGVLPFTGWVYGMVACGTGLLFVLPYLVDGWASRRVTGVRLLLVFPAAWTALEYIYSRAGYGTWGLVGYSQYGNLPLLQVLSVAGLWAFPLLIGGCAALINWAWESRLEGPAVRRSAAAYAAVLLLVMLGGQVRLLLPQPGETVRVASITVPNMEAFRSLWAPLKAGKQPSDADREAGRAKSEALLEQLFAASREEVEAGARVILWSEGNALVWQADEAALIDRGREFAAAHHVYLLMTMATLTPGKPLAENKAVMAAPNGVVTAPYLKTHPTPVEGSVPGDGVVGSLQAPFGQLSWAICYDFDYPDLIRQMGRTGTDIALNPSWDSRGMDPLHTRMATYRSIEYGFAQVRQANGGLSLSVDNRGQVLAAMDDYALPPGTHTMISYLPAQGSRTIYGVAGDWLAWAAMGGLVLLVWQAAAGRRKAGADQAA